MTGVTPVGSRQTAMMHIPRRSGDLGGGVRHRMSCYLNNRLEQDHRGIKGRCRPMLGFKNTLSAKRYCRSYDELRSFLRCRSRMCQHVPAATRRWQHMRKTAIALHLLATA
jgi:putative transposase